MKTRTPQVAERVHRHVLEIAAGEAAVAADYRRLCRRAGSLFRISGLIAFIALLRSKASPREEPQNAAGHLLSHLRTEWLELRYASDADLRDNTMIAWLRGLPLTRYLVVSRHTLRLLRWHRRLCDGLISAGRAAETADKGGNEEGPHLARRENIDLSMPAGLGYATEHNPGLAFGKYVPEFGENRTDEPKEKAERRTGLLGAFLAPGLHSGAAGEAYARALAAYRGALRRGAARGESEWFELTSVTRLIIGLGAKGGLDFGLTFHPVYGTPFLPGSSLKGVAAAHAARVGGADWARSSFTERRAGGPAAVEVFGGRLGDDLFGGSVAFLDAWWLPGATAESPYEREIVTPHYPGYSAGGPHQRPPDGMENPIPFTFLALRAGERFLFALHGPADRRRIARQILASALVTEGIGGKTALGYGRFDHAPASL